MPDDSRPALRARPPSPVDRPPRRLPAWFGALTLLTALIATACDDGGSGVVDGGPPVADATPPDAAPDATPPDAAPDATPPDAAPDATPPDAAPDATPPDAAPPQAVTPAVVAGGATAESARHRLRLSVGGPSPTHVTASDRLQGRIGVALPLPAPEEQAR